MRRSTPLRGPALAPLLVVLVGACGRPLPPSAILFTLDTTNPEALGCYGGPAGLTPHLDRLAAEGIVFEDARSVAPMTLPAHASILTGLYPPRHTVRVNATMVLPEAARTLAERATEGGFQTAAFVASVVLDPEFGLAQGFERYESPSSAGASSAPPSAPEAALDAAAVAERVLGWLEEERDPARPFFLWVHFYDPHYPYEPPLVQRELAGGDAYLGEVAAMDVQIGRILAALEREGLARTTFVAAVADHGEGLGRHGETSHSAFAFDTTLKVPLVLRLADGRQAGRRVAERVSVVDLYPTILEVLGLGDAGDVDGRSLLGPALDPDRGVYFETYFGWVSYGWSQLAGWVDDQGKYLHSSAPEFYALPVDPDELENRYEALGPRRERYRATLARLSSLPSLEPVEGGSDAALTTQIEALGYAGLGSGIEAVPAPLAPTERPAPHERIAAHRDYLEAVAQAERGRHAAAIELLEGIVRETPQNHSAWYLLGTERRAAGDLPGAIEALGTAAELRQGHWLPPLLNLAGCFEELGRLDRAIEAYRRAFADGVGPTDALRRLIRLLEIRRRGEEAEPYRALLRTLEDGG